MLRPKAEDSHGHLAPWKQERLPTMVAVPCLGLPVGGPRAPWVGSRDPRKIFSLWCSTASSMPFLVKGTRR